jgi:hypothetical protein
VLQHSGQGVGQYGHRALLQLFIAFAAEYSGVSYSNATMTVITPLLISLAVGLLPLCSAFVWKLTDDLPAKKILTFSERYMFKSHDGPGILEQGDAYIKVDTKVTA